LQLVRLIPQVEPHLPSAQNSGLVHTVPQAPQLTLSVFVLTQAPVQAVWPAAQVALHFPLEQTSPPAHAVPQAPQLVGSDASVEQTSPHLVWEVGQPIVVPPPQPAHAPRAERKSTKPAPHCWPNPRDVVMS
jgi:hypothetical protein